MWTLPEKHIPVFISDCCTGVDSREDSKSFSALMLLWSAIICPKLILDVVFIWKDQIGLASSQSIENYLIRSKSVRKINRAHAETCN